MSETRSPTPPPSRADSATKVHLEGVSKHYGPVVALANIDLKVRDGEFLTLLGPSGSGKTTLLNLIAGMTSPSTGRIWIDGIDATHLQPSKRGLGMVFQNYALLPHMTVFENVAFPLRVRRVPRAEIKRRVGEALEVVRLPHVAGRKPSELSGGQQQRIAIARCIVYNPAIILMDEPLGALDKKLREEMQLEIKQLHVKLGITVLYVTHDQEEALTMSDRIALLNGGRVEQMGPPSELYFNPRTLFAAQFLGDSNILDAMLQGPDEVVTRDGQRFRTRPAASTPAGTPVKVMVRPENLSLIRDGEDRDLPNRITATMMDTIILGGVVKNYTRLADGSTLVVQELTQVDKAPPAPGSSVCIGWRARDMLVLSA